MDSQGSALSGCRAEPCSCFTAPLVSVIVANHNGARFIEDALASAFRQSLQNIEIIVVDDDSSDDSVARVQAACAEHGNLKLILSPQNLGPGAARNLALDAACGEWIAVLDSDDIMHPGRLAWLVEAAEQDGIDIAADNQLVFDHEGSRRPYPLLPDIAEQNGLVVGTAQYIESNRLFGRAVPLGYLKPIFRRSFIEATGCRYEPSLRIAEDYDFVLRLLLAGGRLRIYPRMTYFYRRHRWSISHRLSARTLQPMLDADDELQGQLALMQPPAGNEVFASLRRRRDSIHDAIAFDGLVASLKRRDWRAAMASIAKRPRAAALLRYPVLDRLRSCMGRPKQQRPKPNQHEGKRVCVISRQRITGPTNGSSAYLLSICAALKREGYVLDLVSPSPAVFGRWPALMMHAEMRIFDRIKIRRAIRIGPLFIATNPAVGMQAAIGLADKLLARFGLNLGSLAKKAPHAIAVSWQQADLLFVAENGRNPDLILTDYGFLNPAIPYALHPRATSLVVMHDLFSNHDAGKAIIKLDLHAEMALLGQADAVIAIQADEGRIVEKHLDKPVILVPMAVNPVPHAQCGEDGLMLFVGSNTQPNIDGLNWFLGEIWPQIRRQAPHARLFVAGSVCGAMLGPPQGVRLLGMVADLAPVYGAAAVVISPLRLGSGLKIKLVEALAHGKAVVATSVTLQGVRDMVGKAVAEADEASDFAACVIRLLHDPALRRRRCDAALDIALRHFSHEACYRDLLGFLRAGRVAQTAMPASPQTSRIVPVNGDLTCEVAQP